MPSNVEGIPDYIPQNQWSETMITTEQITVDDRIRVNDRIYDLAADAESGYVELYVPTPNELANADDFDAAMDQWVLDHVDTRGLAVCGCIAARIDVDRQGNICRMRKGCDTVRTIRVSLCGQSSKHPESTAMARELVQRNPIGAKAKLKETEK